LVKILDLDNVEIEIECPNCEFSNTILLKQVESGKIIICGGCKRNIRLIDYMNEYRKIKRELRETLERLQSILNKEIKV
jgi:hypothetical protein